MHFDLDFAVAGAVPIDYALCQPMVPLMLPKDLRSYTLKQLKKHFAMLTRKEHEAIRPILRRMWREEFEPTFRAQGYA